MFVCSFFSQNKARSFFYFTVNNIHKNQSAPMFFMRKKICCDNIVLGMDSGSAKTMIGPNKIEMLSDLVLAQVSSHSKCLCFPNYFTCTEIVQS